MPLAFERSGGDTYTARGPGYVFRVRAQDNVLTLYNSAVRGGVSLATRFVNSRADARVEATDQQVARRNYFVGNAPEKWRMGVSDYGNVRVSGLYRGVDLIFYGTAERLEYDFVVHPGSDPSAIQLEVQGADTVKISGGDLVLSANGQEVRWKAPVLYQDIAGQRVSVAGRFELRHNRVQFRVGRFDRRQELVIDPVLSYASYFGSTGSDSARAIGLDGAGNVYIAGTTTSPLLPVTASSFQSAYGGDTTDDFSGDAFVAKFNPAGAVQYVTFLGGRRDDLGLSLAVDRAGNAYVTGMTNSLDFPVTAGAFQTKFGGTGGNLCEILGDAFVTKLDPTGSKLLYSTYLGGARDEAGTAIAIDAAGNAFVTGFTISQNFPVTPGAYQTALAGLGQQLGKPYCGGAPWFNTGDAFVTKLNPAGSQLVFSTYLGGGADEFATTLALDGTGNVYVAGYTLSRDFPTTTGALQTTHKGSETQARFWTTGDGFVTKLSSTGASLLYSTYLGGTGDDSIVAIFPAADGTLWITGATTSRDFPLTSNALQKIYAGYDVLPFLIEQLIGDAFVAHLNGTGTALLYSTYLGGGQNDMGTSIAVDAAGLVYVVGFTDSPNFPLSGNALQKKMNGDGNNGNPYFKYGDGFVTVIDPASSRLVYSTYVGGNADDLLWALALDGNGGVWATGSTVSTDFPISANAVQSTYAGANRGSSGFRGDALLIHYTALAFVPTITTSSPLAGGMVGLGYSQTLGATGGTPPYTWSVSSGSLPAGLTLSSSGTISGTPTTAGTSSFTVRVVDSASASATATLTIIIGAAPTGPTILRVVNGASFADAGLAPGLILTLAGARMGPDTGVTLQLDANGRIANILAGVQVLVNGVPAPLLFVRQDQINAVVPYAVAAKVGQSVPVQVVYQGVAGNSVNVPVVATNPAIFQLGNGQGAIRNQDQSVNGANNPAATGSYISIYATGEGQTNPAGIDGLLVADANTQPVAQVSVSIGGIDAPIQFRGSTLFDGFLQINVQVPVGVASGTVPVILTIGGKPSPQGITMAVL
jgi:uncharacterized protein (TIGR03437 family)